MEKKLVVWIRLLPISALRITPRYFHRRLADGTVQGTGKMRVAKLPVGILRVEVRVKRASIGVKSETVNVRGAYCETAQASGGRECPLCRQRHLSNMF